MFSVVLLMQLFALLQEKKLGTPGLLCVLKRNGIVGCCRKKQLGWNHGLADMIVRCRLDEIKSMCQEEKLVVTLLS